MAFLAERPELTQVVPYALIPLGPGVDVSAGHQLVSTWAPVAGANGGSDGSEVTNCRLTLTPTAFEQSRPNLPTATDGNARVVTLPDGEYLTSLTLAGLARVDGGTETAVRGSGDLGGRRLTIALSPGTSAPFGPPVFAVPAVPGSGQLPATLTGAWLESGPAPVVRFGARVSARRVRIALATGDDFAAQPMALGTVTASTETMATDLTVTGPDGAVVWAAAGESAPEVPVEVDLTVPAGLAMNAAVTAPDTAAPAVTFTVRGGPGSHARVDFTAATGALTRTFAGVHTTETDGGYAVATGFTDLPPVVPSTVTGDLTLTYLGLRLHQELSDPLPPETAVLAGPVVRADGPPVLRPLPTAGPGPLPLARIGVHGIGHDAELAVSLVLPDGTPVAPGALTEVTERRLQSAYATERRLQSGRTVWFDVPREVAEAAATASRPLALRVSCARGRFLWADTGGRPVARFVVADVEPPALPVRINGETLASVDKQGVHVAATALPAVAFTTTPPVLDSELFVRVDLSDVVLRYHR